MSAWIKMISDKDADAPLKEVLDLARTPHGTVDNVMRVHSLRPSTAAGPGQIPETKSIAPPLLPPPSQRSPFRLKSTRCKSQRSQEDRIQWHRE